MLFNDFYKVSSLNTNESWKFLENAELIVLMNFIKPSSYFFFSFQQKSYTKKGKAAAKAAAANGKIQNGNANGHITHDINHNVTDTKPSENKKEN